MRCYSDSARNHATTESMLVGMRIAIVRHAESVVPGPGTEDEYVRPLTLEGFSQAQKLVGELDALSPEALYSSPYLRAIQTLEPYAQSKGHTVQIDEEFREHCMAAGPIAHWRDLLRDQWADFSLIPPGGESFHSTLGRGLAVVERLSKLPFETIALAGHGTIITLVLNSLDPSIGLDFHLAMPNPAIFVIDNSSGTWAIGA